jgi:TP901 family phage tail tape measure protein
MAGKVVDIIFRMKDEFSQGVGKMKTSLAESSQQLTRASKQIQGMGKSMQRMGSTLTRSVTVPIAGLAAAGVKNFGEVDKQLRLIEQTMGETKFSAGDLEKAMKNAASSSVFSMQDAADASLNYARAGFDAAEASAMLAPAMNLAAGTSTDLSLVTEGLGNIMKSFNIDMEDAEKTTNIFAQAQAQANTTVSDLFDAFKNGGTAFKTAGWGVEDLSVATGILGDKFIKGAEAGTAFKSGMGSLIKDARKENGLLADMGAKLIDGTGKMKSFTEVQKELHIAFKDLTQTDKIAAAQDLFGKQQYGKWLELIDASPAKVKEMEDQLKSTSVTSRGMADALMSGVGGSIEKLKSTFDVFSYSIGEIAGTYVKPFIDKITELLDKFNNLDEGTRKQIVKFALLAASVGPALLIFGKLTVGVGKVVGIMGKLGKVFRMGKTLLALMNVPGLAVVGVFAAIVAAGILICAEV